MFDFKTAWKHWSTWLAGAGTAALAFFFLLPDIALQTWNMMPAEVKGLLPELTALQISLGLLIASLLAKFVKQEVVLAQVRAFADWLFLMLEGSENVDKR